MTTRTIAQTYASVKETYDHELKVQEKTNRSLARLNAKVEQLLFNLDINDLKSGNPQDLETSIHELRVKLATLGARKVDFEALKERVTAAMEFSTRDPIDEVCFNTISDLDPRLAKKVTKKFNEAQVFNKDLIRNHTHLTKLAEQNNVLVKKLNANINILNDRLENTNRAWVAKVCGWFSNPHIATVVPYTAPISDRQIAECELDSDHEEKVSVAKKQPKAPTPIFIDLTDDEKEAPVVSEKTKTPIFIDLTDDEKEPSVVAEEPSTIVLRSHSKKAEADALVTPAPVALEKPKAAPKHKKKEKAPIAEEHSGRVLRSHSKKAEADASVTPAPVALEKPKAAPKKRARVVEKNEITTTTPPAKKPKVNRELASLGVTKEDLVNVLQSTTRSTRSSSKK